MTTYNLRVFTAVLAALLLLSSLAKAEGAGIEWSILNDETNSLIKSGDYKKGTKVISLQKFKKLTKDEMFAIKEHLPLYLANHEQNRKMDFLPYFQTYINQKRWLDPLPYQNNNQDW